MDTLTQPPDGFHSVMGVATEEGPLNYDELVVYDEAAILPCAAPLCASCAWRRPFRPASLRCPSRSLSFAASDSCRNFPPNSVSLALVASRRLTGRVWPPQLGQGDVRVRQAGGHRARRRGRPGAPRTQPSEALCRLRVKTLAKVSERVKCCVGRAGAGAGAGGGGGHGGDGRGVAARGADAGRAGHAGARHRDPPDQAAAHLRDAKLWLGKWANQREEGGLSL